MSSVPSLSCESLQKDKSLILLSPKLGYMQFLVVEGQTIGPQQHIGDLWQLGCRFRLLSGPQTRGKIVSLKNQHRMVPVMYREQLLRVDADKDSYDDASIGGVERECLSETHVVSPMDGMFYLSPSPSAPSFVSVGDTISLDQTVGLIEVMKCFYPVKYQGLQQAKITGVEVKNATPVTVGTKLFTVEES